MLIANEMVYFKRMQSSKINLIAVDDEKDLNILFQHFFRNEIKQDLLDLSFAHDAEQCMKLLTEINTSNRIIVLSDINMPDINGIELTKMINKDYPNVEVYLITAYQKDHIQDKIADTIQIKGIIHKPIDFQTLKFDIGL